MSKKKKIILFGIALIAFLIATILGFTYSKYASSVEVTGKADTAIWSFDGAISNTENKTTKTINLARTLSEDPNAKIAPGTSGNFKIIINADGSEVDVDYDVLLKSESTSKPENLYFTCADLENPSTPVQDYHKYYTLADMLEVDATGRSKLHGTIEQASNGTAKEITVNWNWPYESTREGKSQAELDKLDTDASGITDYSFTLNILGKQKR